MSLVLGKALKLIELVAKGNDTLTGLIAEADLSRSTTHRLLNTLVEHGYLAYADRRYEIGYRFLELGELKRRSLAFVDIIRPELEDHARVLGDTIHVAILDGTDILLVERIAGNRELQIRSHVGQRAPAFRTAVGKALISRRPATTWNGYLRSVPSGYLRSRTMLREDFQKAKADRFAIDFEEVSVGTCGIASAFRVNKGLDAAVSVNGATVYFPPDRMRELAKVVINLARQFSEKIRSTVDDA